MKTLLVILAFFMSTAAIAKPFDFSTLCSQYNRYVDIRCISKSDNDLELIRYFAGHEFKGVKTQALSKTQVQYTCVYESTKFLAGYRSGEKYELAETSETQHFIVKRTPDLMNLASLVNFQNPRLEVTALAKKKGFKFVKADEKLIDVKISTGIERAQMSRLDDYGAFEGEMVLQLDQKLAQRYVTGKNCFGSF